VSAFELQPPPASASRHVTKARVLFFLRLSEQID
jgi:hypothetical protein